MVEFIGVIIFLGLGFTLSSTASFILCTFIRYIGLSIIESSNCADPDTAITKLQHVTYMIEHGLAIVFGVILAWIFGIGGILS